MNEGELPPQREQQIEMSLWRNGPTWQKHKYCNDTQAKQSDIHKRQKWHMFVFLYLMLMRYQARHEGRLESRSSQDSSNLFLYIRECVGDFQQIRGHACDSSTDHSLERICKYEFIEFRSQCFRFYNKSSLFLSSKDVNREGGGKKILLPLLVL